MPPTAKQRQDAGRQLGRDLDIENDTRRQSGLAPVTTERIPALNTGSIDAASLAAPVSRVNVPEPVQSIVQPPRGIDAVRDNLTFDIQEFRNNQAQVRENFQILQAIGGGQSMQDQRTQLNDQFNIPANQTRLQDIQTQLAGLSTQSLDTQVNIASEAGATGATSQRAMSAEKSKNNVRSYGLAAEASILQGNIESARAFVNDAMTTIYQDRQLERQNLIDQNNALSNILDPQRAEILMQDNREYEEEIAATQRVQGAVDAAMQSGAATADDVKILTDPTLTDEDRLAAAQGIVSRGQTEMRNLDMAQQQASIDSSRASAANSFDSIRSRRLNDELAQAERLNSGNQFGTVDGKAQTAVQLEANGYADRLVESEAIISQLGDMFTGQEAFGGLLPNAMQSSERQQFEQSKRNFINSVLRRESGAAIADSEFESADLQYFPQRGDSPEVAAQKSRNRNTVINNLYRESNTFRPVSAGDIIESDGIKYQVGADGQTLTEI